MDIKNLNYKERLQLLKDLFDNTNIVLTAAYGATGYIEGDDIIIAPEEEAPRDAHGGRPFCRTDFFNDSNAEALIIIHTDICTG